MQIVSLSAALVRFIESLGICLDDQQMACPTWDGQMLHLFRLRERWHVLHELGHWLAAPPAHRVLPNYGLGADPDTGIKTPLADLDWLGVPAVHVVTWGGAQEAAAALLCGVLLYRFGPDWDVRRIEETSRDEKQQRMFFQGAAHLHSLGVEWWCLTAAAAGSHLVG